MEFFGRIPERLERGRDHLTMPDFADMNDIAEALLRPVPGLGSESI